MNRNTNRQEALLAAAEKMKQKKEQEEREENEFYQRITSGTPWLIFKVLVVFCSLMALLTTIDLVVDGPSKKLTEDDWKIDREWEWTWHKIIDVEGYLFAPTLKDWGNRVDGSLEITYSSVFRSGKKLGYEKQITEDRTRWHQEMRMHSLFTWFPAFQIFALIPLFTFIFKRQKPWFSFARIISLYVVFPGTLMVIYYAMM